MIEQHESKRKQVGRWEVFRMWNTYNGEESSHYVQVVDPKYNVESKTDGVYGIISRKFAKEFKREATQCRSMILLPADNKEQAKEISKRVRKILERH